MKGILRILKTTTVGGLFFVVPIALLIWGIIKIVIAFRKIVEPVANRIDFTIWGGDTSARILSVLLLLLVCFLMGLIAKSRLADRLKNWIEDNILSILPGYSLIKGMTETAAGMESNNKKNVVLVNMEEVWQVGFLMEKIDDDLNAVFIPGAPNPLAGSVIFVKWDRLKIIDLNQLNAMKISRKLGIGTRKMMAGKISKDIFSENA